MKTYNKPKLFSFSRSHAAVPAAVVAALPAVTAVAAGVSAASLAVAGAAVAAKKMVGDDRAEKDVEALIPVEVI